MVIDEAEFNARIPAENSAKGHHFGMGRELFGGFRIHASSAETGASNLFVVD
jgi:phosphogluconate dehydratase